MQTSDVVCRFALSRTSKKAYEFLNNPKLNDGLMG